MKAMAAEKRWLQGSEGFKEVSAAANLGTMVCKFSATSRS